MIADQTQRLLISATLLRQNQFGIRLRCLFGYQTLDSVNNCFIFHKNYLNLYR